MSARQVLTIACYIEMRKSACNTCLLADAQTAFENSQNKASPLSIKLA